MKGSIAELIQANPNLPIFAWVDTDVVGDDSHGQWLGEIASAEVKEYLFFEQYDDTYTITRDGTERIEEYLWDNRETYLGMAGFDEIGSDMEESDRQEKEFDGKIQAYIDALNWQKAIFINVGAPNNAKTVTFPVNKWEGTK